METFQLKSKYLNMIMKSKYDHEHNQANNLSLPYVCSVGITTWLYMTYWAERELIYCMHLTVIAVIIQLQMSYTSYNFLLLDLVGKDICAIMAWCL